MDARRRSRRYVCVCMCMSECACGINLYANLFERVFFSHIFFFSQKEHRPFPSAEEIEKRKDEMKYAIYKFSP